MSSEQQAVLIQEQSGTKNSRYEIMDDNNYNNAASPQKPLPWYDRVRSRQIFAALGVFLFVLILLILIWIFKDMVDNNNNNTDPHANDPLWKTGGVVPCSHPVYCTGDLLKEVQMTGVFSDNMRFVDLPIKESVQSVLGNFSSLLSSKGSKSQQEWNQTLYNFLNQHFLLTASDIEDAGVPADFPASFPALPNITDANLQTFANDVHLKWKELYRFFNLSKFCTNCSSAISLPFPFIVPGGRFSTTYYWDSYWIIKGLLTSQMFSTARKMILNLLSLVSRLGYVPNGSRIYLGDRSQPPLLTQMVYEYVQETGDTSLILIALPTLDKEYKFWDTYRRAELSGYPPAAQKTRLLSRYYCALNFPRPEGYAIDVKIQQQAPSWNSGTAYMNLRAAAETGWDFSSRWFKDRATIENINTNNIVPVDLNAILLRNEQILESWFANSADGSSYSPFASQQRSQFYGQQWRTRQQSMLDLMWSNDTNCFRDIGLTYSDFILPSVSAPKQYALYGAMGTALSVQSLADAIKSYGKQDAAVSNINSALGGVGGVGTSNISNSGQQWDGVDEWSPVVYFVQQAFQNLGKATEANDLVSKWITQTYCGYKWTGIIGGVKVSKAMWEKYNSSQIGFPGTGGEYTVQTGFGWTNGLTLRWLQQYGATLTAPTCPTM